MLGLSVLYIFAHQDDEILILPKMAADLKSGRQVHAVWITDGGKSANPVRRQQESRAVMKMVGMPETNLHFLGFPDQKSHHWLRPAYERVWPVASSNSFTEITSPAYEGGNIDHDVAAFLAAQIARNAPSHPLHYEYPLYNRYRGKRRVGVFLPATGTEERSMKLDSESRALIRNAIKQYRSERLPLWLMERVANKSGLFESLPYRIAPNHNFLERPAAEPCDYERSFTHRARFSDWQKRVEEFSRSAD